MRSSKVMPLSYSVLKRTICSPWFLLSLPCTLEPTQVMFSPISSPKLFFLKGSNCFPFNKSKHNFNFVLHALSAIFDLMENIFFFIFWLSGLKFQRGNMFTGFPPCLLSLSFSVCFVSPHLPPFPHPSVLFLLLSDILHIQVSWHSSFYNDFNNLYSLMIFRFISPAQISLLNSILYIKLPVWYIVFKQLLGVADLRCPKLNYW